MKDRGHYPCIDHGRVYELCLRQDRIAIARKQNAYLGTISSREYPPRLHKFQTGRVKNAIATHQFALVDHRCDDELRASQNVSVKVFTRKFSSLVTMLITIVFLRHERRLNMYKCPGKERKWRPANAQGALESCENGGGVRQTKKEDQDQQRPRKVTHRISNSDHHHHHHPPASES